MRYVFFAHMKTSWGCTLSIFTEALIASEKMRQYEDDCYPLAEHLDTCSKIDNELWREEALLVEELSANHGLKPDFYEICERAIMERFAEEEAARAERAA